MPYKAFEALCKEMPEAPGINLSGKISPHKDVALTVPGKELLFTGKDTVQTALQEVGYPYTVEFKICPDEKTNISGVLFRGAHATVYTNWENTGRIAFSRDGYTFVFNSYRLPAADGLPSALKEITRALPCMWTVNCRSVWKAEPCGSIILSISRWMRCAIKRLWSFLCSR